MIQGIHHLAIHVRDMERMISFYGNAFGFEVVGEPFSWSDSELIDRIVDDALVHILIEPDAEPPAPSLGPEEVLSIGPELI